MNNIKEFVNKWKQDIINEKGDSEISLAIIQVGDVEASNRYVKNKLKDCEEVGIKGHLYKLDENISTKDVCDIINSCRENGIIVQLPLPKSIDVNEVIKTIPIEKDVDGFKLGTKFTPCTPGGIITYLEKNNFNFDGKFAVVLGRSEIVGKPISKLLLEKNCTVVTCHTHTHDDLKNYLLSKADLVICATGHRGAMKSSDAPNAFIVDVGINFNDSGKLCGDVIIEQGDDDRVTPVPGGVGLLTRCMLLYNTLIAYKGEQ